MVGVSKRAGPRRSVQKRLARPDPHSKVGQKTESAGGADGPKTGWLAKVIIK